MKSLRYLTYILLITAILVSCESTEPLEQINPIMDGPESLIPDVDEIDPGWNTGMRGKVKRARSNGQILQNSFIANAQITFIQKDGSFNATMHSGGDGSYSISLPAGDYRVYVSKRGYIPKEYQSLYVRQGSYRGQTLAMRILAVSW